MKQEENAAAGGALVSVTLENVSKAFAGNPVLHGISLALYSGIVTALVGGNAAGKSTIARILAGDIAPSGGTIRIKAEVFDHLSRDAADRLGVGMVYQDLGLCERLNAVQNIFLGRELIVRRWPFRALRVLDRQRMTQLSRERLSAVGVVVEDVLLPVSSLSGGQRQAAALAKVLDLSREILILDEPTSALAVSAKRRVHEVVKKLAGGGRTVLYVTHDSSEILDVADRVAVLEHGRLVYDGPVNEWEAAVHEPR